MPTFGTQDIRFLLSRVRGEWMAEENGGLAPLGPTGIRDVQGLGNNNTNEQAPGYWFGAGDTLFTRWTFNRLTATSTNKDVISAPFANPQNRGPDKIITIGDTAVIGGKTVDALNPRNISNLIGDSTNTVGFEALSQTDPNYAAKHELKLMDDPTGRLSPISGAVNPLVYSNWTSQFGQFFDHGLDFVAKGVDGKVVVDLLPSDGLYTAGRATTIEASRNNTANVTIGEGSTDALLDKLGLLGQQGQISWVTTATITKPSVAGGANFAYEGTLVLNNTLIKIQAFDEVDLVNTINLYTPTTGVVASVTEFPAVTGVSEVGSFQLKLTPARAESFNQTSPFIDLSQNYGSDTSRTVFLREYMTQDEWDNAPLNVGLTANVTDLTTGRLLNAGASVAGVANEAGMANWLLVKQNAAKVGIILHDADISAIPLVAFDANGNLILDVNGMPQLVALNKVTGEIVYVKDTTLANDAAIQAQVADVNTNWAATDFVLMTTKHAFLNDMGFGALPSPTTSPQSWNGRDLVNADLLNAHLVSGDGRLNENIGLTAVHEAFLTEHNRVLQELKDLYGFTGEQPKGGWTWTDPLTNVTTKVTGEELFQQAKLVVEMEYQHLVFGQFVRKLSPNIAGFAGVNPAIDARISSEFANAVYRLGHSMLPEAVGMRKYTDGTAITVDANGDIVVTMPGHSLSNYISPTPPYQPDPTKNPVVTLSSIDEDIGGIPAASLNGDFIVTVIDANTFKFTPATPGTVGATGTLADKIQIDLNKGLIDAFLSPKSYTPGVTSGLLADGSSAQVGNRIDEKVTDALRDNLLGKPLDLFTLNIVRGRDAGLPTLNEMRGAIQAAVTANTLAPGFNVALAATLTPYTSWSNFRDNLKGTIDEQNATVKNFIMAYASDDILTKYATTKTLTQWNTLRESTVAADQQEYMAALKAAANAAFADATWMGTGGNMDFNRIDAWIGGLAEREVVGGMLGSTFDAVFAMQMMNLQNGDKFYYLGRVAATEWFAENVEGNHLADLVMRSTGATNVYADIFSVADKYIDLEDIGQPAAVETIAELVASTTLVTDAFDIAGNVITAEVGRAGYVTDVAGSTFYGNMGNYLDARGVLNPNGVGNASESMVGTVGGDRVFAMGGNDTVRGGDGDDFIDGGSGVDFLYGDAGNDFLDGGAENDFMYGGDGDDSMRGGVGVDLMFGNNGNDTMYGGLDGDIMQGGAGDDIMYGGDGLTDPLTGILDPEPAVAVGLLDDALQGGAGNDMLYGGGGWDTLNGDSGHDTLFPGAGGAALGGRDVMDGGEGDDIYIIESATDFLSQDIADGGLRRDQLVNKGAAFRVGNGIAVDEVRFTQTVAGDIIIGGTNPATAVASIFTGVERVVIGTGTGTTANRNGTAAINIDASLATPGLATLNEGLEILGNAGDNIIIGTNFNDVLDGGAGADTLEGLIGNDTYVVDNAGDIVTETTGGGTDSVTLTGNFNYTLGAEIENLTMQGNGQNNQQGYGNALANVITGNNAANDLRGFAGNDTISGGGGGDRIDGGAGVDNLTGGTGADTFVFASRADIGNNAALRETITDFRAAGQGNDLIDLTWVDADENTAGHQAFNYASIGNSATFGPGAAGRLAYANGVLYGETTGDGIADFQIALTGAPALAANMFVANSTVSLARAGNTPAGGVNEGNTGFSTHTFTVTLLAAQATDTTIAYAVTGAAGVTGADFVGGNLPAGSLVIAAGSTTGTITVQVAGDVVSETNEVFTVSLTGVSGSTAVLGNTVSATSTILNDDAGGVAPTGPAIRGTNRNDPNITGTDLSESIDARRGNDIVNALGGNDTVLGGGGNDTLNGGAGDDNMDGGTGNDTLNGGLGNDTLNGGTGVDVLNGGLGNDTLNGGTGVDVLNGEDGNDILIDSTGRDTMTGGLGADTFRFSANIADIGLAANTRDIVNDFSRAQLDLIDLSAVDADTTVAGNQAFTFIGNAAFTGMGQLRYANGVLEGNVQNGMTADFAITVTGAPALQASDFIL